MKTKTDFANAMTSFMSEYLPHERNVSKNTIASYKVTFSDLIIFMEQCKSVTVDRLSLRDLTRANILEYLKWLESSKNVSTTTRNCRLAAIKSLCRYLQYKAVDLLAQWQDILSIRVKKSEKKALEYLTPDGIKLLLEQPDQSLPCGRRHLTLLSLLYDTGARVQEIADLTVGSLRIDSTPYTIKIVGKGRKARVIPLSKEMVAVLKSYLMENEMTMSTYSSPLFQNARGEKLTREGITYILKKYAELARCEKPELIPARISPHCIRHSRAMHLLHDGAMHIVDLRDFLGHASIITTGIYARADSKTKREALEKAYQNTASDMPTKKWEEDKDLLEWLKCLGR